MITRTELLELDIDTRIVDLWELLDALDDETFSVEEMAAFMRAAYGKGYYDALGEDVRGRLCREHGYIVPRGRA